MNGLRYSLRVGLAAGLALAETTVAQTYPSQQVRMVVGYAAGGGADGLIRAIAPELGEVLGQSVVIDNRGGGGTVIGTHIVAASKPDGYTFYVADNAYIVNPALMSKLPYDSLRDFVPVVVFSSSSGSLLSVHPSLPAKSVKEFIALARAHPGKLNYATGGNGTIPHMMGELLKVVAKINLLHIPYKGTGLAIHAAVSGEVTVVMGGIFAVKPLADAGRLRVLATASAERISFLPDVPTFAESGWPAIESTGYRGLLAPAGTPRDLIMHVNAAVNKALQMPAVHARLIDAGSTPLGGPPEDYGRVIRSEMDKWGKIIRASGIRLD